MFKQVQKLARSLIVLTVSLFTVSCLLLAWYVYGIHSTSRTVEPSLAFWMDHAWSTASAPSFTDLETQIATYPIDELYFHVGPLSEDGQLATDLSISPEKLAALEATNYAWIGQVRSSIDLDSPTVRANIVASSQWVLTQGFDGIHLDIEPVHSDDTAFVQLLQELRAALPTTKISVAMDEWQPLFLSNWVAQTFNVPIQSYWSTQQVQTVTPYIDELVVMTYDTGFHDPELYEWWVEQQTIALSQIVPATVTVRVGIPTYAKGASFDPAAENLTTGLAGFTRGVQNVRSNLSRLTGLAIYPYWEMDTADWQTLENL